MTRFLDLDEPEKYSQIIFVEFLNFIGRVSLDYFEELDDPLNPRDLEDRAHVILKILWDRCSPKDPDSNKAGGGRKRDRSKKDNVEIKFPEL
jgi:hypothetical protein